MRILYVEDNMANVQLVKRVARVGNHEVLTYMDGEEALQRYDSIQPDLILMDIQLAGSMSGLDVVREIRGNGHDVPIIAVTAYAMVGDKERCIEAGCTDYVAKPLPIQRLIELITHYDQIRESSAAKTKAATEKPDTAVPDSSAVATPMADKEISDNEPVAATQIDADTKPAEPEDLTDLAEAIIEPDPAPLNNASAETETKQASAK